MFPVDNPGFDSSNFSGFNFEGFDYPGDAKPTYREFDDNNFASD